MIQKHITGHFPAVQALIAIAENLYFLMKCVPGKPEGIYALQHSTSVIVDDSILCFNVKFK